MDNSYRIEVDPSGNMLYSSFYLHLLYKDFGKANLSFSKKHFTSLKKREESHSFDHYMAFVAIHKMTGHITRCIIDFRDKRSVKESAYAWSDVYAKINFHPHKTDVRFHPKIISIPPTFGIHIWNLAETVLHCGLNYLKINFSPLEGIKKHLSDYYNQWKRPSLKDYLAGSPQRGNDRPYVFMIATLWTHQNCLESTNLLRKTFMETCMSLDCDFEGGFHSSPAHPQYAEFRHLAFANRYHPSEYLTKTKASLVVFNTPAVHDCHGWKLGEYLAMGKAIISTPLSNELPEPLEHGKNIHFINDLADLKNALELILFDRDYRETLETGARDYFARQYSSIKHIIFKQPYEVAERTAPVSL